MITKPSGIIAYKYLFKICTAIAFLLLISVSASAQEICNNGIDDNGNGLIDCADPACYLASNTGGTDTDGDGIDNNCDQDDDNDGVLDVVECSITCNDPFVNGSFENTIPILPPASITITAASNVPGWQTTENFNGFPEIEIWSSGFGGVPAAEGNQFAELNAYTNGTLYQTFCLNGASGVVNWTLQHRGRGGVDVAAVKFGPDLASTLASAPAATLTTGTSAWQTYSGTYTIPAGQTTLVIAFQAISTGSGSISVGNFIDNIGIQIVQGCPDTDLDGVINALDLDSDNDACSDADEFYNTATADGNDNQVYGIGVPPVNTLGRITTASYVGSYNNAVNNAVFTACVEICGNGIDDDGDGIIDLADPDCRPLCSGTSGNVLLNPNFEIPPLPVGNNFFGWPILGWTGIGTSANIVRPSSTFTGGGPNAAQNGDQYLDIASGSADFWQEFTFSCNTRVFFSGYFSVRASTPSTGRIDLYRVDTVGGPLVVASSNQLNMPGIMDVWYLTSGTAVISPGTYRFQISMGDYSNFDNACFSYDAPVVSTGSYGPLCSSGGSITLTGTPTNSFGAWTGTGVTDNGNGTATFNPTGLGGQNITVQYSNFDLSGVGCISSTVISVICCNPSISAPTVTQPTCILNTGTIVVNATGTGALEYSINGAAGPFQSSNTFSGLAAGNYNIRVRAVGNPTCFSDYASNPVVLVAPTPPSIFGSRFNPSTCSGTDGSITITGLSANTNYTLQYNDDGSPVSMPITSTGAGQYVMAGLNAGTYSNIRVVIGVCTSNALTVLLTDPTPPTITSTSSNPTTCLGTNGTITINGLLASTTYTLQYSDDGTPVSTSITTNAGGSFTVTGLNAGAYTNIRVTRLACTSNALSATLADPPTPVISGITFSNPTTCLGTNGSFTINGLLASTTYTLQYSDDGTPVSTSITTNAGGSFTVTGLNAGAYTNIRVTLAACTSNAVSATLTDPPTPVISGISFSNPTTCLGTNGSFTITGLNASTSYTVQYNDDATPITTTLSSNASGQITVSGLNQGAYTNIRVTLAACTSNAVSATLTDPPTPIIASITSVNPTDCGANDGSFTLTGLFPSVSFTVQYDDDGTPVTVTVSSTASGTLTITGLNAGTYTNIRVTRFACTSNNVGVILSDPALPVINPILTFVQPTCLVTTGSITINATPLGSIQYSVNGPAGPYQSSPNFALLLPGTYNLSVRLSASPNCVITHGVPINLVSPSTCPEICNNGLDDDGDGLIDCADPDCYLASNSGDLDSDGDNIGNGCDLDDDNDGVVDLEECPQAPFQSLTLGDISAGGLPVDISARWGLAPGSVLVTLQSNTGLLVNDSVSNNNIRLRVSGTQPVYAQITQARALSPGTYDGIRSQDGTNYVLTNALQSPLAQVNGGGVYRVFLPTSAAFPAAQVLDYTWRSLDAVQDVVIFTTDVSSAIAIQLRPILPCDFDGDGAINSLDLDSDDDTCPDAAEAHVPSVISPDNQVDAPFGNNGLANYIENNDSPTAIITYTSAYLLNALNTTIVACPEICGNGLDDDGDGLADCADSDCAAPLATNILGSNNLCANVSEIYSVVPNPGVSTYNWTVPTGWIITSGQGTSTITVTPNNTGGNICVTFSNAYCTSAPACLPVTVTLIPAAPSQIIRN